MEIEGRSSYFAEDVLIGILSRLPVKSLLRFKCVSKEWRALIQSSYFTALHLKQSDSNLLLISKTIAKHTEDGHEFAMSLVCNESTPELNLDVSYIGCTIWPWSVSVVGSSNGLVCLLCNRDDPKGKLHKVVVWNPATKQFRCSTHETADDKSLRGFAFIDHDISDYKLVSILANKEHGSTIFRAKIFTGSTNSWREVDSHCCSSAAVSYRKTSTITLNGVLYSLLWKRNYSADSLLSFNFRDEVFAVIPLPEGIAITEKNFRTLLSWKKSLAFLIEKNFFELWVMTDEPSAGATQISWVKQFRLKPSIIPVYIHGCFKDEYLFGEDIYQELHCYNPESQRLIKLPQHDQKHRYFYDRVINYVESLVSVD